MTSEPLGAPILEAKLYPASGTARRLPRPRLDACGDVLDGNYPVVVVVAPAGYGKSTLMASWHATLTERGVPCAWLSLDADDEDTVRCMRHLVAALQKVDKGIGRAVSGHLAGDLPSGAKSLLEALASELTRFKGRLVLFLDDLHFVREPQVVEIFDWLVNYAPRTVQFVIGSRDEPRLRLSGLRVRRQLFEVDIQQLQFGADEVAQFYRSRLGRDMALRDLEQLLRKTEGWPAALELAALVLESATDQPAFIEQFAGTDRSLVDYLGEAVLSRLDENLREFVFRVAMFDRVCAPLAQSLGEFDDAEELLSALRARNLFLIPLDRSGTWVRFHHLVGEFFREHFRRSAPARARECLIRGAGWLHAHGYVEDAVNCAIQAGDWEQVTQWVADCVEEFASRRGYHHTILRWMQALPEPWVDRHPTIRIQFAFSLSFFPHEQQYEAQVHRLERQLLRLESEPQADPHLVDELRCAVELQAALSLALRDEGARGGELAAAWLERWPGASLLRKGVMGNVLAFGHKTVGEIGKGLETLAETRRWLAQCEGYYSLAWTDFLEALLHLKRGSYFEARCTCVNGLALIERKLNGHPTHASLLHTLLAGIAYEFDEIGPAVEHLEQAMSSVDEYGPADALMVAYLTKARLQRLRHDEGSALAILREGQELAQRRGLRRVTVTLAAEECNNLARAGCYDEARVVATRYGFSDLRAGSAVSGLAADKALRAASRYWLRRSPRAVIEALAGAIADSEARNLAHRTVQLRLLRALAFQQDGRRRSAIDDMHRALAIAAPRRYVRVFLDEAADLRPLIDQLDPEALRDSDAAPLARKLQQLMRSARDSRPCKRSDAPAAVDALTRRELAILRRLESGLTNREIAEAMFISEGTLKWHLHNVYGKLNVRNRSGAILRARGLGVL